MEIDEKIKLNKLIRKYDGDNSFITSLKKSLSSKWCSKVELNNKVIKVLSIRQYEVFKTLI